MRKTKIIFDIILVITSLVLLIYGIITSYSTLYICLDTLLLVYWLSSLINDIYSKPISKRCFEVVYDEFRKNPNSEIKLPCRGTKHAMAYDFYAPIDYEVKPNDTVKIWTDVKAKMRINEGLLLNVRSSMGGKFQLANTQGWIDSDYYENENNDGNIGIFLTNISEDVIKIKQGDRIAQGMFINFLIADEGNTDTVRKGGFGSTNE